VVNFVQARFDDRLAECFEAADIQSDIVVYDENGPGAMPICVPNVCDDPIEGIGVEIAASHLNNRTKAAVIGAATRRLHYINLPAKERIATEHTRIPLG